MNKIAKYSLVGIGSFVALGTLGNLLPDQPVQNTTVASSTAAPEKVTEVTEKKEVKAPIDNTKQIAKVESELKREAKIKDLFHDSSLAVQWTVGVLDDGSRRFGYAGYVCQVITDGGALERDGSTYVRVVDVVKVANGESPRSASLGQVRCNDQEVIER